jgi:hypothetical protein
VSSPAKPVIMVLGMMGRTPFAGVAWQVLHYLEGFRRLGYDVYYFEDTGDWPYDPEQNTITSDCRYTTAFIGRLMAWCGMPDRWAYRAEAQNGRVYGLPEARVAQLFREAAALVNLTGATVLREEYLRVPVRIYLETDPVLPQIEIAQGRRFTIDLLNAHTHYFTYGENLGAPDCDVPTTHFRYQPTRQPIILDWWESPRNGRKIEQEQTEGTEKIVLSPSVSSVGSCSQPLGARFTTVASWKQTGKDIEWKGQTYRWSKHYEFMKFVDLPRRARGQSFELALACGDPEAVALLTAHGWHVVDALALSKDLFPYRDYIRGSGAEFTVAKDQNIRLRSGWFSDRSACYLAAGRPVITQDTGFGNILPTGRGLFAFRTVDDVLAAIDALAGDYRGHSRAAREIAAEYFAAENVVGRLMKQTGL